MKSSYIISPFILFFTFLTYFVSDHIFFWDTVQLGAKHGLHFYDTKFSEILLPDAIDSGHVPIFGMYLAWIWVIFGKSLFVSHFAMLPFLIGIVIQAFLLLKRYVPAKYLPLALTLFLFEPTLLGQSILISPDIPLVFFFLLGVNSILNNSRNLLLLSIIGLFLISMRGGMISFGLLLLDLHFNFKRQSNHPIIITLAKMSLAYLPGFVLFCTYNYFHYLQKNWIGYHDASPWATSFQLTNTIGILKNLIIMAWRLLDFGRIFLWVAGIWMLFHHFTKLKYDPLFKEIVIIFFTVLGCSSVSFLLYEGLNAHRYILPVYLLFSLLVIYMLFNTDTPKKTTITIILWLGLLSGHMWIYPTHIAQGWDASLAHLPYYDLRAKILADMQKNKIPIESVACVFPNQSEQRYMDLSDNKVKHQAFDADTSRYVLFSNVYNDYKDEDVIMFHKKFKVLDHEEKMGLFLTLYERK